MDSVRENSLGVGVIDGMDGINGAIPEKVALANDGGSPCMPPAIRVGDPNLGSPLNVARALAPVAPNGTAIRGLLDISIMSMECAAIGPRTRPMVALYAECGSCVLIPKRTPMLSRHRMSIFAYFFGMTNVVAGGRG